MHSYAAQQVYLFIALILAKSSSSAPQVAFPISSQVPPVAYALQPYEFVFSPNTFSETTKSVSYTLSNQPFWLSIDSAGRRLSGTPTFGDIGTFNFQIVATDTNGRVAASATLVILEKRSLSVSNEQIILQLSSTGKVSAPATLLLYPEQSFQFMLSHDLFDGASSSTLFYGISSNGTPLPSWVQFDSRSLRFSGTTPPLLAPKPSNQSYLFKLVASNIVGYSEASVQFEILIGDRLVAFAEPFWNFTATSGLSFQISSLLARLSIDGNALERGQIVSARTNPPSWLHFDDRDLSFNGMVPADAESVSFLLSVDSVGSSSASTTINVQIDGSKNGALVNLGTVSAFGGTYFVYPIDRSSVFNDGKNVTISAINLPYWLSLTATNWTLQGLVPANASSERESISFSLTSKASSILATLTIYINPSTNTSRPPGTTTTTGSETSKPVVDGTSLSSRRLTAVILAVVLPVIALILLAGIILIWMRKRRKLQPAAKDETHEVAPQQLTRPPLQQTESEIGNELYLPGSVLPYENAVRAVESVPQIDLSWAPDSLKRAPGRLSKKPKSSRSSTIGSSWDDLIDFRIRSKDVLPPLPSDYLNSQDRKESDATLILRPPALRIPPKRPRRPDSPFREQQPSTLRSAKNSKQFMGMSNRLSAAGHGAGGGQYSIYSDPRSSWQTTLGSMPLAEPRPSVITLSSFPAPPSQNSINAESSTQMSSVQRNVNPQPTLRLVESTSNESLSHSVARQRQSTGKAKSKFGGPSRFSTTHSNSTSIPFSSSGGVGSVTNKPETEISRSGMARHPPPLPQRSEARMRESQSFIPNVSGRKGHVSKEIHRELSATSSHQFDSAVSSESQWEDENLMPNNGMIGNTAETGHLSDKPRKEVVDLTSDNRTYLESQQPQLADHRKRVSIKNPELERSERSQKGSLRFI